MTEALAATLSDRLTRLAIRAVAATGAAALLVSGDQHTVLGAYPGSKHGPDPILVALCKRVAARETALRVPDITKDRALAVRLPVSAPGTPPARSYAGVPLRDDRDEVVGALTVSVAHPRHWTDEDLAALDDAGRLFASGVRDELLRQVVEQHRQAERDRAFLDALLDNLDVGVAACDGWGNLALFNRAQRRILGTDVDGTPSDQWGARFRVRHLDGRTLTEDEMPLIRALRGEAVRSADLVIDQPDGRACVYRVNAQPMIGAAGERLGAVAASHDITQVRRTERLHACEIAVARALVPAGDGQDAVPAALEALVRALGWAHAEWWQVDRVGGVLRLEESWTVPEFAPAVVAPGPVLRGHGLAGAAWRTGGLIWAPDVVDVDSPAPGVPLRAAVAVPVHGEPDVLGVLVAYTTGHEEPDDALRALFSGVAAHIGQVAERRRAEELALRLVRAKDEYIALVGHELRTPLTSIASYTEVLAQTGDTVNLAQVRPMLEVIDRNTARLRAVVDDLLDLAALDSGHAELARERVDLARVVRDCVRAMAAEAERGQVTVMLRVPTRADVIGDRTRLRQLLDNLLGNAIMYTPGGRVELSCVVEDDSVVLTVVDNGMGIPEEERDLVARRFYRGRAARDQGLPGHGLGLAICGVIVERHGGGITLSPTEGGGTTVEVRLLRR